MSFVRINDEGMLHIANKVSTDASELQKELPTRLGRWLQLILSVRALSIDVGYILG